MLVFYFELYYMFLINSNSKLVFLSNCYFYPYLAIKIQVYKKFTIEIWYKGKSMRLKNFATVILLQALSVGTSFALGAGPAPKAASTAVSKIIVIVNKDPISQSDLDDRIKLITLMSGMSAKKQDMEKMRNQILQSLIQEKIQIHAAKSKKIVVSDAEVENTLQIMAKDNNMSYDQFLGILSRNNIPKETLTTRIKAQMAWVRYIRQQFAPVVHVADSEVEKTLKKIENLKNKTQYLVSEIMLLISNPSKEGNVHNDATKLVNDLRAGANFGMLAQQLSKSSNAASGGDLGWVTLEQIDPSVANAIQNLKPGNVSSPIRTPAGFKIVKLKEIRQAGEADPNEAEISFCQAFFPITPNSSQEDMMRVGPQVEATLAVTGCENFKKQIKAYNIEYKHNAGVKMGQLPEQLKAILKTASTGKCLEPIMTEHGLLVQIVCDKKAAKFVLPSSDQIREELEQQKMTRQATRELQRLMSVAYFEFKDPSYASVMS